MTLLVASICLNPRSESFKSDACHAISTFFEHHGLNLLIIKIWRDDHIVLTIRVDHLMHGILVDRHSITLVAEAIGRVDLSSLKKDVVLVLRIVVWSHHGRVLRSTGQASV